MLEHCREMGLLIGKGGLAGNTLRITTQLIREGRVTTTKARAKALRDQALADIYKTIQAEWSIPDDDGQTDVIN